MEQYVSYWRDLLGDGVTERIGNAVPWSFAILGTALVIAFGVGSALGAWLARPGRGRGASCRCR